MKLDDLLVDELALVRVHSVRVQGTSFFVALTLLVVADCWGDGSGEAEGDLHDLFVAAVGALVAGHSCSDGGLASGGNNSGDDHDLADLVAVKIANHERVLVRVDLNLELGL